MGLDEYRSRIVAEIRQTCVPFYEKWLICMERKFRLPRLASSLLFALTPYLCGLLFLFAAGSDVNAYTKFWLSVNFSAWIAGMFLFMSYIYNKTIDLVDEILFIVVQKDQADAVRDSYQLMFTSKYQLVHGIVWGVIIAAIGLTMGVPLDLWGTIYMGFAATGIGFLVSTGLWYTITSAMLVYRYSHFRDVSFNIIDPSRTIGIRELANLMGTWGICLLLEAILILFGFFYADWGFSQEIVDILHFIWTLFILGLILFVFVFPHLCIQRMIVRGKRLGARKYHQLMSDITARISTNTPEDRQEAERNLVLLNQCQEVYQNISRSPTLAVDVSVVGKFFSALIVPIVITLLDKPNIIYAVIDFFRGLARS